MLTHSFTHNGATVTVRRATVRDRLRQDTVIWALPDSTDIAERHMQVSFARAVVLSTVDGDLGFAWPDANASEEALNEAFEHFMNADGLLWDQWQIALARVSAPLNEQALSPQADEKNSTPAPSNEG